MKTFKRVLLALFLIGMALAGYAAWILLGSKTSNPNNYRIIGEISTPWGSLTWD